MFRPEAQAEVVRAKSWYEEQRVGLGELFATELERVLDSIVEQPGFHPRVNGEARRAIFRRFPYAVFFQATDLEVIVVCVMHGRRDPDRWRSRN